MTPGWGRKKCPRRTCPLPLSIPMPRPCLDSLQIPKLRPCALQRRTEFVPRCAQNSCGVKHSICHCTVKNYCTAETCTNPQNCTQFQNIFCSDGVKGDKDENDVCKGPCHAQERLERNSVKDYEKTEPVCNEASCEKLENCGIGSITNDEELNSPVTYTPSVTNQSLLSTPPIELSRQEPFNDNSATKINYINDPPLSVVGFTSRGMGPKPNNFDAVNRISNLSRCIQVNLQNEAVLERGRDAETSVAPEVGCNGNEVQSQYKLYNVDKDSVPVQSINSPIEAATGIYDTNTQSDSQSSRTSESHLNSHVSNIEDKGGYFKDNIMSHTDENYYDPNKSTLNSCCEHSFTLPASFERKYQEQLNNAENGKFGEDYHGVREISPPNTKLFPEQDENQTRRSNLNGTPVQPTSQRLPGTTDDQIRIPDNSQHILPRENVQSNFIPSSTRATPNFNESSSNELAKISLSGNNSTNERRLFNEGKNQFMSSTPNDSYIRGATQRYLDSPESTGQKTPQFTSPTASNYQPRRSSTNPPLCTNTSQVIFHKNSDINNPTYSLPIESQNLKYNAHPRSSHMQTNYNQSEEINNKIKPINNAFSNENVDVCKNCNPDKCDHGVTETAPKLNCVCPDKVVSLTNPKDKRKKTKKLKTNDLKDIRCQKKPACVIENGTSSCASTTCIVNQQVGCSCRYPPAFKQFVCTGNISGICNCNDKK